MQVRSKWTGALQPGVWHRRCQHHLYLANGSDPAWGEYGGDALPPSQQFSKLVHPWVGQPRPAQITAVYQREPSKPCARMGGLCVRRRDWIPLL